MYEDEEVNRLVEAQILFDSVINSRWFESSTRIVFFNKIDLAREKLAREPLANFFPELCVRRGTRQLLKILLTSLRLQQRNLDRGCP